MSEQYKFFAFRNKRTKQFVSGTDYRYYPPHCIMCDPYRRPLLVSGLFLKNEIAKRNINLKRYEVVLVELKVIQEVNANEI